MIRHIAPLSLLAVLLAPIAAVAQPAQRPDAPYDLEHIRADVWLLDEPIVHARLFLRRLAETDTLALHAPGLAFDSLAVTDADGARRAFYATTADADGRLRLALAPPEAAGGRLTVEAFYRPGPLLGRAPTDSSYAVWTDRDWLPTLGPDDRTSAELFLTLNPGASLASGLAEAAPPAGGAESTRLLLAPRAVAPSALAFAAGEWHLEDGATDVGRRDIPLVVAQRPGGEAPAMIDVRHAVACLSAWYAALPPTPRVAVATVPDIIAGPPRPGLVLLPAGADRAALYERVARQWTGALVRDADDLNERIAQRAARACLAVGPSGALPDADREARDAVAAYLQRFAYAAAGRTEWAALTSAAPEDPLADESPRLRAGYRHTGRRVTIEVQRLDAGTTPIDLDVEVAGLFESSHRSWRLDERRASLVISFPEIPRFVWIATADDRVQLEMEQTPEAWVSLLQQAEEAPARLAAARALLDADPDPLLSVGLRSAFVEEQDPVVRAALAIALAAVAPRDAARRAMLDAVQDQAPAVRIAALEALAAMGGLAAEDAARDAAYNDSDADVQAAAVAALVRVGTSAASEVLRSALVTPSPGDAIRLRALRLLHESPIETAEAVAHASTVADTAFAFPIRLAAVAALVSLPEGPERDAALLARLDDSALGIRQAAAEALLASEAPALREQARRRLSAHSDPLLRALAARDSPEP